MTTRREILKYDLDFEKTLPYFIDHIECGNTLSKTCVKKINFKNGSFFTILPSTAGLERLYEFHYGGIIPAVSYGKQFYTIKGLKEPFQPKQVITMDREFSEFISSYIQNHPGNSAVIENVLERDENFSKIDNVKTLEYRNEIYYFLDLKNSIEEIFTTLRCSGEVWHFLAILTFTGQPLTQILENKDFDQICNHARYVVASAYDGEGYIFWKRSEF